MVTQTLHIQPDCTEELNEVLAGTHLCFMSEVLFLVILPHAHLVNTNSFATAIADIMILTKDFTLSTL